MTQHVTQHFHLLKYVSMVIDAYLFICKKLQQFEYQPVMVERTRPVKTVHPSHVAHASQVQGQGQHIHGQGQCHPGMASESQNTRPMVQPISPEKSQIETPTQPPPPPSRPSPPAVAMISPIAVIESSSLTTHAATHAEEENTTETCVEMDQSEMKGIKQEVVEEEHFHVVDLDAEEAAALVTKSDPTMPTVPPQGIEFTASTSTELPHVRNYIGTAIRVTIVDDKIIFRQVKAAQRALLAE